jgi:hypothetical protein
MAPTTIPAMAPLGRPDDEDEEAATFWAFDADDDCGARVDDSGAAVDDADATVNDVDDNVVADEPDDDATKDELAPFDDNEPPSTCASKMTEFVAQQSVLSPQHHCSLSAFPLHGVTRTFPNGYLGRHMLRQFLLLTSLSVQKSTQYLKRHVSIDYCEC